MNRVPISYLPSGGSSTAIEAASQTNGSFDTKVNASTILEFSKDNAAPNSSDCEDVDAKLEV